LGLSAGAGDDQLSGNSGNDRLFAHSGDDNLRGGNGNDRLDGGAGNDVLYGGTGNDTLDGGTGNDVLTGDAGRDIFAFSRGDGFDRITDFEAGVDRIDLRGTDVDDFNDFQVVEDNGTVFIFIDELTSIELTGVDNVSDITVDDFIL